MMVTVDLEDAGGAEDAEQWVSYKMWRMGIPEKLKQYEAEIVANLKEAFTALKYGGVHSSATSFTATFDF